MLRRRTRLLLRILPSRSVSNAGAVLPAQRSPPPGFVKGSPLGPGQRHPTALMFWGEQPLSSWSPPRGTNTGRGLWEPTLSAGLPCCVSKGDRNAREWKAVERAQPSGGRAIGVTSPSRPHPTRTRRRGAFRGSGQRVPVGRGRIAVVSHRYFLKNRNNNNLYIYIFLPTFYVRTL